MPEKAPHPDTYESPTNIPTFIEGGTLDNEGSHNADSFLDYNSVAEVQGHLTGSEYLPRGIDIKGTQLNSLLAPVILGLGQTTDSTSKTYGDGWNMFTFNSPIQENAVEALFKAFHPNLYGTPDFLTETAMNNLLKFSINIIKNNAAQVYWPLFGFNGIGDLIPGQGYLIRLAKLRLYEGNLVGTGGYSDQDDISLSSATPILGFEYGTNENYIYGAHVTANVRVAAVKFRPLDPNFILNTTPDAYQQLVNDIEIDLEEGWNMIGYTGFKKGDMVDILFEALFPDLNPNTATSTKHSKINEKVEIVKSNAAAVYWPEYSFNGIGDILPGQGYQFKVREDLTIKWPTTTYPTASNGEFSYFDD